MLISVDKHFLIYNASPREVQYVLRCLDSEVAYSNEELREHLRADWGYEAQKNLSLSTRRLYDLGLARRLSTVGGKQGYVVTSIGEKVRQLLDLDPALSSDVMHYLHYHGWDGKPQTRKLFWSYRQCSDIVWDRQELPRTSDLASEVQARIARDFPDLYAARLGGNFNAGGVNSGWKPWVARLVPSPFRTDSRAIQPRQVPRFELILLALDDVYRARGYRYGDPVILDDAILNQIASVFFLDLNCCRELIDLAARLSHVIKLSDTFAGTSVTLLEPYGVERI